MKSWANLKLIQCLSEIVKRLPVGPCESHHITNMAKISRDHLQKRTLKNLEIQTELADAKKKTQEKKRVRNDLEEQLKLNLLNLQMIRIYEEIKAIDDNIKEFKEEHSRLKDEIRVLEEQLEHLKSSGLIFFPAWKRVRPQRILSMACPVRLGSIPVLTWPVTSPPPIRAWNRTLDRTSNRTMGYPFPRKDMGPETWVPPPPPHPCGRTHLWKHRLQ